MIARKLVTGSRGLIPSRSLDWMTAVGVSLRNGIQGSRALCARTLTAHFVPEPFATSQDEWLCPAAPGSRDRRHSGKSDPGQDPAQPSLVPQGAGGARRCGWE